MPKKKLIRLTTIDGSLYSLLEGQLKYLNEEFDVIAVGKDTGRSEALAEREGVRVVNVDMHREISLKADFKALFALYRLFRKERPDIVHANTPKGSLLGMMAAWLARVPHRIYLVTGLRFETATGSFRTLLKTMERITCLCATKVIPEGDGVKATLIREGITRKPMQKIHNGNINGIDMAKFDPELPEVKAMAESLRSEKFTFVFVGRIVKDKGVNELVEAFVRLSKEQPDVRLLLLGRFEDDLDPVLPQTKREISENPNIEFVGYQSDVRPYIAASNVLVLPSYREGFPNVVLQGGALGLPCIVTDINGANEIIEDGVNGLIVAKQDADALYRAMRDIKADYAEYARMASVAREMIDARFRREDVWRETRGMYKSLI